MHQRTNYMKFSESSWSENASQAKRRKNNLRLFDYFEPVDTQWSFNLRNNSALYLGNRPGLLSPLEKKLTLPSLSTISYNMAAGYASCATLWIYKRSEVLYKEKNENFPNLVKRFPLAPQALICSHVSKSSSQDGCMNLSLNRVFTKYIANSDFPTPLDLCPFSTTSSIHLLKK